jgi:gas vesicle protein
MRSSDFLIGFLIGGLTGAAAVLLYTPDSGKNMRVQARNYADRIQDEVKQAATARRNQLEEELSNLRAPKPSTPK